MAKQRILSEFMCREMLYDYATQSLKPSDRVAVELALEEYLHLKDEVRQIYGAFNYCATLANTEVNDTLLAEMMSGDSFLRSLYERWTQLSPLVRYGSPAIFICALAIVILRIFIPNWNVHGAPDTMTLAKIDREAKITPEADESIGLAARPNESGGVTSTSSTTTTTTANSPSTTLAGAPMAIATAVTPTDNTTIKTTVTTTTKREGFVYRAFVHVTDPDQASAQTKAKILELGGTKAGEVELGWQASDGRYFHFVLKESDYEVMETFLKSLGPVRIQKVRHPRLMPEGEIRFILLIQDTVKPAKRDDGNATSSDDASNDANGENDSGSDTGGGKSDLQQSSGQPESAAPVPDAGAQDSGKKKPE